MPIPDYIANKDRQELLEFLSSGIEPGSVLHLQAESALHVRIVDDVEREVRSLERAVREAAAAVQQGSRTLDQAIREAASSSQALGRRLYWLNVILAAATAVGAFAALWSAFA